MRCQGDWDVPWAKIYGPGEGREDSPRGEMHPVCGDAVAVAGAGGAGVVGAWGDSGGGAGVPVD